MINSSQMLYYFSLFTILKLQLTSKTNMNGHNSGNEISSTSEYTDSKCNIFQEKWKSYYIHKSVLKM